MFHPALYKYVELKAQRFGHLANYNQDKEIMSAVETILESFHTPIVIDGINWWSMADALKTFFSKVSFDEDTFNDVCENEDWEWSDETMDLKHILEEVVRKVYISDKKLEDWL